MYVYIEKMRGAMLTRKVIDSTKALKAVDRVGVVWGNLKARGAELVILDNNIFISLADDSR